MPVRQYVYFSLSSLETSAAAMSAALGLDADETSVRGSRIAGPRPKPVAHRWKLVCRETERTVDEQIACVLGRLAPFTEAVAALARTLDAESAEDCEAPSAVLQVVRRFEGGGEEEPNLFGWHLGRDVLDFLQRAGAVLDVDEYDLTGGPDHRPDQ